MLALVVLVRIGVCAVVATMALAKLATFPASADTMWRPSWLPPRTMRPLVLTVCVLEVAYASIVLFDMLPASWMLVSSVGLFALLSAYGYMALQRSGHCGCGGTDSSGIASSGRGLLLRNGAIFGSAAASSLLGPPTLEVTLGPTAILGFAGMPYILWSSALLWRIVCSSGRRQPRHPDSSRFSSYRKLRAAFAAGAIKR
jgi:hypothetical protein